ncbi:hypothetical protein RFI_30657 [Reticulomyxa filosa]|uniref:Uncharacterized protein n=1 Tax=Reticulomyxa filosa TaxID=46433 RepID=X6LYM8_RETFI|nr:hypothetical protein RFI_30657 [Reticulomyxa filosa]|eukprot:ETO06734.1 hypothetical protein RFI_30657 [Reticulomyxa filosa]
MFSRAQFLNIVGRHAHACVLQQRYFAKSVPKKFQKRDGVISTPKKPELQQILNKLLDDTAKADPGLVDDQQAEISEKNVQNENVVSKETVIPSVESSIPTESNTSITEDIPFTASTLPPPPPQPQPLQSSQDIQASKEAWANICVTLEEISRNFWYHHPTSYRLKKKMANENVVAKGIHSSLKSIDEANIRRIDKTYTKLMGLETLHLKNIQHSLHNLYDLRNEVKEVNTRIDNVLGRMRELRSVRQRSGWNGR